MLMAIAEFIIMWRLRTLCMSCFMPLQIWISLLDETSAVLSSETPKVVSSKYSPELNVMYFSCYFWVDNFIASLTSIPKILLTRLPVLWQGMDQNSRAGSDRMSWTIPSSTSWTPAILTMPTTSTRSKSSRRGKVSIHAPMAWQRLPGFDHFSFLWFLGQEPMAPSRQGLGIAPAKPAVEQQLPKQLVEHTFPKEPPPEFEFIADPPSISAFDLWVPHPLSSHISRWMSDL